MRHKNARRACRALLAIVVTFTLAPISALAGTYIVQPGDWLSTIAPRYGLTWQELHALNPQIKNPDLIYPGQILQLDSGSAKPAEPKPPLPPPPPVLEEDGDSMDGGAEAAKGYPIPEELRAVYDGFIGAADADFGYNIAVELSENPAFLSSSLGTRTAGSAAEHAAANWLAGQMKEIGLADVEMVGVDCDMWQFNDASFQIVGDGKIIKPHSYATGSTPKDGITAEVIYVGEGTMYDYDSVDAEGKIVLVDINQRDNWWITYPMLEAWHHGALAIMSAQDGGFSEISADALNCQDICGPAGFPCVSVSWNDAEYIKGKLREGPVEATLVVDNEVAIGKGTSYNVVGKIEGKSSDYQIIFSGHYDMYFSGFQDDNCAVGIVLAIAKAMIDSGYVPENDILFVLHGAEEWGASYTQYDWTVGAWEMIFHARPEWRGKTLAMINFELPAYEFETYTYTESPYELFGMLGFYTNIWPLSPEPEGCYPDGILTDGFMSYTYSDDFSYLTAGIPAIVNGFLFTWDGSDVFRFYHEIYHSDFDTKDTYNEKVMDFNIQYYGALGLYIDQTPALYLDFLGQCDRLLTAVDAEILEMIGLEEETRSYLAALDGMFEAAGALTEDVNALNLKYYQAWADGADPMGLAGLRAEGAALTEKNLKIFSFAQEAFLSLMYEWPIVPHEASQYNIEVMAAIVAYLEEGYIEGALDLALLVNNAMEWYEMFFSPEVAAIQHDMFWGGSNQGNLYWGTGRTFVKADVGAATRGLVIKFEEGLTDYGEEIAIYEREIEAQKKLLSELLERETADIRKITTMLME